MPAAKIMIIRHAGKPNGDRGVLPDGSLEDEALTVTGWQRAGGLINLFGRSQAGSLRATAASTICLQPGD